MNRKTLIPIGSKMVIRKTTYADDGVHRGGSNVPMSGLIMRWCDRDDRDGGGYDRKIDVYVDVDIYVDVDVDVDIDADVDIDVYIKKT